MNAFQIIPIGKIENKNGVVSVKLKEEYAKGLTGLEGFSHVQILWWADGCDNPQSRAALTEEKPYRKGPDTLGVFSTRSPERPNPIAMSVAGVAYVDAEKGVVGLYYLDAFDQTPVIDLKPYTPSLDRVAQPRTPDWCRHWPQSYEESGNFDWASEFNF